MLELGRKFDLALEPLAAERHRQLGVEHLHRDIALVLEVVRQKHRRHAAASEFADNVVSAGERHREPDLRFRSLRRPRNARSRVLKRDVESAFHAERRLSGDGGSTFWASRRLRNNPPRFASGGK